MPHKYRGLLNKIYFTTRLEVSCFVSIAANYYFIKLFHLLIKSICRISSMLIKNYQLQQRSSYLRSVEPGLRTGSKMLRHFRNSEAAKIISKLIKRGPTFKETRHKSEEKSFMVSNFECHSFCTWDMCMCEQAADGADGEKVDIAVDPEKSLNQSEKRCWLKV